MTEDKNLMLSHTVSIKGRNSLIITGITDLSSFNEDQVVVYTCEGELIITGEGLHIGNINVDRGELNLDGRIESLEYTDNASSGGKIWEKLFR